MQETLSFANTYLLYALDGRAKDRYSVAADPERTLRLTQLLHKFLTLLSLDSSGPSTILGTLDDAVFKLGRTVSTHEYKLNKEIDAIVETPNVTQRVPDVVTFSLHYMHII